MNKNKRVVLVLVCSYWYARTRARRLFGICYIKVEVDPVDVCVCTRSDRGV